MTLFRSADSNAPHDRLPARAGELASAIFDAAPMPMWVYDRESLAIVEVNAQAVARYGYSRAELLGMRVVDLMAGEDLRVLHGEPVPGRPMECLHRWKDGSVRHVSVTEQDVEHGDRTLRLAMVDDVTDRVLADRARAMLLTAVEHLDEIVLVLEAPAGSTRRPQVSYANVAVERVLGVPRRMPAGGNYHPDRTPPELASLRDAVAAVLVPGQSSRREITWTGAAGRAHRLEVVAVPVAGLRPDGGMQYWAVAARDVTELRAMGERSAQAERLESLGLLAGSIAHDFNNLVHVITGFSELALSQLPPNGPPTAHIQQAHQAALRAAGLAKQLLAFSRRQQLKPVRLDLRALVTGLRPVLVRLAGTRVPVDIQSGETPAMVCADPTQMEQIFLNLVVNARDAQPEGGRVEIRVDVVERERVPRERLPHDATAPCWVRIRVTDAGPGMPPEVQARVFEPFFTTKPQGTGLGLPTVYRIVRQSAGTVRLSTGQSGGLCVEILLPEAPPTGGQSSERS